MSPRLILVALLPIAAIIVVAAVVVVVSGSGSSDGSDSPLAGISAEDFAQLGITVAEPGEATDIDNEEAIERAFAYRGMGEARQALLVRMKFGDHAGDLAWAINYDPDTVVGSPPLGGCFNYDAEDLRPAYSLDYIDAVTGEWIAGMERSDPESLEPC